MHSSFERSSQFGLKDNLWQLALFAFIAAFLLISSIGVLLFHRQNTLSETLASSGAGGRRQFIAEHCAHARLPDRKTGKAFSKGSAEKPGRRLNSSEAADSRGLSGTQPMSTFSIALRLLVPALLCILATVTQVYTYAPLFVYALAAGLGFMAPDFWLSNRISARQLKLRLGLPEALDLIVICVEAGLSMDKATMRTSEELRISQPAIADELNLVYLEQRAGRPRGEAWKHLGDRTDVDNIRSLASILIQADKFGTSIGKTLRAHSETLRTRRRQDAEEQAAKTTVKLVFPLVLFIFPSLFVVTLGPSMIIMFEGFAKYLS